MMEKTYRAMEGCGLTGNMYLQETEQGYTFAQVDLSADNGKIIQGDLFLDELFGESTEEETSDRHIRMLTWEEDDTKETDLAEGSPIFYVLEMDEDRILLQYPAAVMLTPPKDADLRIFTFLREE